MDKKEITSYARGYEKGREVGRREIIEKLKSKMWDKFNKKKRPNHNWINDYDLVIAEAEDSDINQLLDESEYAWEGMNQIIKKQTE